ncbi:unnamed protein product [Cylicostephanus goldi]|uniref:Uncharacterized protein n=1 Tax=Cylicostephanus goldi TaxID=71465 RepID=A0A3P7MLM4_CYLGO|nr:unnamed protein product [Cylicostephanus goldi]
MAVPAQQSATVLTIWRVPSSHSSGVSRFVCKFNRVLPQDSDGRIGPIERVGPVIKLSGCVFRGQCYAVQHFHAILEIAEVSE